VLLALCALVLLRMAALNSQAVRSSGNIHTYILSRVLNAPIPSFFDVHTVGEVLNRFAKDLEIVDTSIPEFFLQFLTNWFQIAAIFLLCVWSTPYFLLLMAPLSYAFYKVYASFACVSRDLRRLEGLMRTPVYASFSETLSGLDTIRAYGDGDRFIACHRARMDRLQKVSFHSQMAMSWVTARLELMASLVLLSVAMLAVAVRSSVSVVGVGMALVYTLQLTAMFQRCVQLTIDLQGYFTSAERLLSYATIPQEQETRHAGGGEKGKIESGGGDGGGGGGRLLSATGATEAAGGAASAGAGRSLADWPERGEVEFCGVDMRYRENDLVLRGLSFKAVSGTRVGVCGRTGAGKSSIVTALLRVVEFEAGRVLIDGLDTRSVPLSVLRTRLAVIPQDPVLFSGCMRFQLDPFEEYSDVEVWAALEHVYMAEQVRGMGGLTAGVAESGDNLSQGQRQLLCIARALLRRSRVLVLDEATAAVDPHTDGHIQRLLRSSAVQVRYY
jgi:ATP-binding cassette subfamily C (CFTR/MRP) protein 1